LNLFKFELTQGP